jgi:hypothetical protein
MRKDKLAGAGILLASVLVAIAYALLIYFGYGSTLVIILVSVALYILLGIVGWIGWTMATTPSPKSIEAGSETQPSEIAAAGKTRRGRPRKKA